MENLGFQVKVAENGQEGVDLFKSWSPHFIWMDRRMPVMDGLEATRRIRELDGGREVKIVALTASVFKEQHEEMLAAGMDDFVRKPYRPDEIFDCMSRHLAVRFVYQTEREASSAETLPEISPQDLADLGDELRQELSEAVSTLYADEIADIIGRISAVDEHLGKILRRHADNFEYTQILRALHADMTT